MFEESEKKSIGNVKKEHVRRYSAKCRHYMMVYNAYDNNEDPLTCHMIERFVKIAKCHQNIADQCKAFIKKAWKEAQMNFDED